MWKTITACGIAAAILLALAPADADESEREALLALMDKAFAAIGENDEEGLRALQLAEGTSISFRKDPDGSAGELLMRMSTNEELLTASSDTADRYVERWTATPTVLIRGPMTYSRRMVEDGFDMDANSHMENTANRDKTADVRQHCLVGNGLPAEGFSRLERRRDSARPGGRLACHASRSGL